MAFDERDRGAPALVGPHAYHPAAPVLPDVFQTALEAAYCRAMKSGRLLGVQTYLSWSAWRTHVRNATYHRSTTLAKVAEARRYISGHFDSVHFFGVYRAWGQNQQVIRHTLHCTDGTTALASNNIDLPWQDTSASDLHGAFGPIIGLAAEAVAPSGGPAQVGVAQGSLTISQAPANCVVTVKGTSLLATDTAQVGGTFMPVQYVLWAEPFAAEEDL